MILLHRRLPRQGESPRDKAYHGPSLIICYAPCINHGIKIGMGRTQNEEKKAVECGYWHLWHYNPEEDGQVLKAANTFE